MPTVVRCLLIGGLVLGLGIGSATAQAPTPSDSSRLPEIAPREIEIRGQLQIALPTLERQPLQGFATPPSLPTVPPDREPYVAPYKQDLASLPDSLPTPETMGAAVEPAPPPQTGYLEVGGGRYFSRFAEGRFSTPLSAHETLSLRGHYDGTEGHTPFEGLDAQSARDAAGVGVRFESQRDPLQVEAALDGAVDRYALFGAARSGPNGTSVPDRTLLTGGGHATLRTVGPVAAHLTAGYDQTSLRTAPENDASTTLSEGLLRLDGGLGAPLGPLRGELDVRYTRAQLGEDASGTETTLDAGGRVTVVDGSRLTVRAGARALRTDGPVTPSRDGTGTVTDTYIAPSGHLEWRPTGWATLFARNTPRLGDGTLRTLAASNPYVTPTPSSRPTLYTTDARAGTNLSAGWVQFHTFVGYRYAPSYRFFRPAGARPTGGFFSVDYGSVRILRGGGEVALQGIDGVQAALGVTARQGRFAGTDTAVPYLAPVTADAMVSLTFAEDRARVQATGTLQGPRYTSLNGTNQVGTFAALDLVGSYSVTSILDVVLRIKNVGSSPLERWPRYPEPPATVAGGFRIRW